MVMRGRASAKLPEQVKGQRAGATVGRTVHFSERLWAFVVTLGLIVILLAAQLCTTVMQIGLFQAFRLRIDAIVFGATIAGPELSLLPWLIGAGAYMLVAFRHWKRLLWCAAPVALMLLGDGLSGLRGLRAESAGAAAGIGWVLEFAGGIQFAVGGNLPATAGFIIGFIVMMKKLLFDLLVAQPIPHPVQLRER